MENLEVRQLRIGTTPWENPETYVKNSPIFYVGDVQAPLLLVHSKKDGNVDFGQGQEFFIALRRAGKRAWLLEYERQAHGVYGEDYKDYLLRSTQFFDHYLKGRPASKWMTRGRPAIYKNIENGFDLDSEIRTPIHGGLLKMTDIKKVD